MYSINSKLSRWLSFFFIFSTYALCDAADGFNETAYYKEQYEKIKARYEGKLAKQALVLLATGVEEMEAIITIDVLRRGGVDVVLAGVTKWNPIRGNSEIALYADKPIKEAMDGDYDVIIVPGGVIGRNNLIQSPEVTFLLQRQEKLGRYIAAICAGVLVLKENKIYVGKRLTTYPSYSKQISEGNMYQYCEQYVTVDGKLITSQAPGTAFEFALTILEHLRTQAIRFQIEKDLLLGPEIKF